LKELSTRKILDIEKRDKNIFREAIQIKEEFLVIDLKKDTILDIKNML